MAVRRVLGVEFADKPAGRAKYARELTRWRLIVDGIEAVDALLPGKEYRLHVVLMRAYVLAEVKRREVAANEGSGGNQLFFNEVRPDPFGGGFPG